MFNTEELEIVKKNALKNHIPNIMDDTLNVIVQILKKENPKRILEIGTAVGYSASCFAQYTSEDCIIDTIELDEIKAEEAKINIEKIGVKNRINIFIGNAVDILPTFNKKYDIIFILLYYKIIVNLKC